MASGPTPSHILNLGPLIQIPVKSFPAARNKSTELVNLHRKCVTEGAAEPSFNQLKKCSACGDILTNDQMKTEAVKGYPKAAGGWHLFNNEEIESLAVASSKQMNIEGFCSFIDIDPVWLGLGNHIGPLESALKPFMLLHSLMRGEGLAALVTYYGHGRDKIGILRPTPETLMLHDAYFAPEIREYAKGDRGWLPPNRLDGGRSVDFSAGEMRLGLELVKRQVLTEPFETAVGRLRDGYLDRLAKLIEAREAGAEAPVFAPAAKQSAAMDLIAALEASLGAGSQNQAPAPASKPPVKMEAEKPAAKPAKRKKSA